MKSTGQPFSREELWRKFDFLRESLASAGKSQARFMAGLLTYLALLWGWNYTKLSGFKVTILGVELNSDGLWMVSPAVLTVLTLALIGSMNIMGPIWKRFSDCCNELGVKVVWTDTDPNKTLVDFFVFLKLAPEGSIQPDVSVEREKFRVSVFSYPAVITFATVTTALADYPGASCRYRVYVYGLVLVQVLFSFRIWYRAVCRFFVVRIEQTEI